MLNIPRETIGSIIRKFKAKGTVETLPGRGRKKMLTSTAVRYLKRRVEKSPRVTAEELRKDLSDVATEVSAQTIWRTLRNEGLHARTPRRTPLLSPKNKKSRLQYAKSHVDKPQNTIPKLLWFVHMTFGILQSTLLILWRQQGGAPGSSGMEAFITQCAPYCLS
uniref:Transposase Tc1-like domain-containing protein n=1 Tax=Leptobrachium leishanense TaxID=445787 RepID=A0A8C5QCR6_9ANUR